MLLVVTKLKKAKLMFSEFIYLLIFGFAGFSLLLGRFFSFGEQGLLCSCEAQASCCGGVSCCRVSVAPGLWSTGSVAVVHRLSRSEAYGIFPDQRSHPRLLHWQADPSPLSNQGSLQVYFLIGKVE